MGGKRHGYARRVFVDRRVSDYQSLLLNLSPDTEIVLLDPDTGGVLQIANWLSGKSGYDAIHVLSHGSSGQLDLGNASLNSHKLTDCADALAIIGYALTAEGDLLLYRLTHSHRTRYFFSLSSRQRQSRTASLRWLYPTCLCQYPLYRLARLRASSNG